MITKGTITSTEKTRIVSENPIANSKMYAYYLSALKDMNNRGINLTDEIMDTEILKARDKAFDEIKDII